MGISPTWGSSPPPMPPFAGDTIDAPEEYADGNVSPILVPAVPVPFPDEIVPFPPISQEPTRFPDEEPPSYFRSFVQIAETIFSELESFFEWCFSFSPPTEEEIVDACEKRQGRLAVDLIQRKKDLTWKGSEGEILLHVACRTGLPRVVSTLLQRGQDPRALDDKKRTPLHFAAESGSLEIVKKLISVGVEVDSPNKFGDTPLLCACEKERLDVAAYLLKQGADVGAKATVGLTPIERVFKRRNSRLAALLIKEGREAVLYPKALRGESILHRTWRLYSSRPEVRAFILGILDEGIDVDIRDSCKRTLLHYACDGIEDVEGIQELILRGADPHAEDDRHDTPMKMVERFRFDRTGLLFIMSKTEQRDFIQRQREQKS